MKRLLITLMFLSVLASAVSALQISEGNTLTFGGTSQSRDVNISKTFTVFNEDNQSTSVTFSSTIASKYKLNLNPANFTLASGASQVVTVNVFVPVDFDAVDDNLVETSFSIGTISVKGTLGSGNDTSIAVNMQAENRLRFSKGEARISGSTDRTKSIRDRTRIDRLKPGDSIKIDLEVENTFSNRRRSTEGPRNVDVEFDDVDVRMEITSDEDFDIGTDDDSFSLSADDKETASFDLRLEDDARDRSHSVIVRIDGRDEFGARHGEQVSFTLDIERDAHDLVLRHISFTPLRVTCARNVLVSASLLNRGRINEDESTIQVEVPELGIIQRGDVVEIDEDDEASATVSFNVPDNVRPATYSARIYSLYDATTKNNFKDVTFTVDTCEQNEPEQSVVQPSVTQPPVVQQPVVTQPPVVVSPPPEVTPTPTAAPQVTPQDVTAENSQTYTWVLVLGIIIVAALIVFLVIKFAKTS